MASLSFFAFSTIKGTTNRDGNEPNKQNRSSIKMNGATRNPCAKVDLLGQKKGAATTTSISTSENLYIHTQKVCQNIPTKKQLVDPFRQGLIMQGVPGYRQTVVIRSYEVGPDKTATIESILNLLQETASNYIRMSGLLGDGFGATHGMTRNNLIWVVSRMQVQVDRYPIWGEVMEIDTWFGASGRNGMRVTWLLRSHATGLVFARATSTWLVMNQKTRRLSRIPDEVRTEMSPLLTDKQAIKEDTREKIEKLDDNATYVISGLKPKRNDLDMNQHVNNVKYVSWILEAIPDAFLENHQLSGIILEYKRECGSSDVIQSLCEPNGRGILEGGLVTDGVQQNNKNSPLNGISMSSRFIEGNGLPESLNPGPSSYTHLLQVKGESKNEESVRGKTTWKRKINGKGFTG